MSSVTKDVKDAQFRTSYKLFLSIPAFVDLTHLVRVFIGERTNERKQCVTMLSLFIYPYFGAVILSYQFFFADFFFHFVCVKQYCLDALFFKSNFVNDIFWANCQKSDNVIIFPSLFIIETISNCEANSQQ